MTDAYPLSAETTRIGRQPHEVVAAYWPGPYELPASRAHLVERY
jgi:hypothetical protein